MYWNKYIFNAYEVGGI